MKNTAAATISTLTLTGTSTFGGSINDGGGTTALAITTGSAVALNGSSNYTGLTTLGSGATGIALTIGASGNLGSASGAVTVGAARNVVTYAGSGTITKGALTLNQTAAGVNQLDLRSTGGGGFEFTGTVTNASPNAAIYLSQSGSPAALKLSGTFTTGDFGIAGRGGSVTFANTSGTQTLSGVWHGSHCLCEHFGQQLQRRAQRRGRTTTSPAPTPTPARRLSQPAHCW